VIETRYVPVPVVLEPRETVNSMSLALLLTWSSHMPFIDQGALRVTLLTGHDIPAADRGGKSDPYAVFYLNRERVFKSLTKKKTVNPEWHEDFTVEVVSIHISGTKKCAITMSHPVITCRCRFPDRGIRLESTGPSEIAWNCKDQPGRYRTSHCHRQYSHTIFRKVWDQRPD